MKRALLTIVLTVALGACGTRNSATSDGAGGTIVTQSDGQGRTMTAHVSDGDVTPVPTDLPKWSPAFPGAKVAQVMVQNDKGASVKSVVLTTGEDMKTVVAFYNAKIQASGATPTMTQDTPEGSVRMVESASGAKDMLMIGRSDDTTSITMGYSIKP